MEQLARLGLFSSPTNEKEILHTVYHSAIDQELPVALWSLPDSDTSDIIIDFAEKKYFSLDNLKETPFGFVFSKFIRENDQDSLFIKAGLHLKLSSNQVITLNENINSQQENEKYELFIQYYKKYNTHSKKIKWISNPYLKNENNTLASQQEYCTLVNAAVDEIVHNKLEKIVVSRVAAVNLADHFNPIDVFIQLKKRYPHLFISLVSIPDEGTWIGASPEHLLTLKKESLNIVALAGTQAWQEKMMLSDISWKEKEIREQALVSHYIRSFLHRNNASWKENGPQTVSAGKIVHLQTTFSISIDENNKFPLALKIIEELHPTSAICGMPKQEALAFIRQHEHYDRDFYCGFLGPVNMQGESYLFVNIRCMQLTEEKAYLYAGTGITSDSIAENEWTETILKIETLLPVLRNA